MTRADTLLAEDGADERDHDRRRREHEGTVGDGRERQPADEEVLIKKMPDDAERRELERIAGRDACWSTEDTVETACVLGADAGGRP